jgi:hypothetical protein
MSGLACFGAVLLFLGQLTAAPPQQFAPNRVIVVYRNGITAPQEVVTVSGPMAGVPAYTNDPVVNRVLAELGVDRSEHLFSHVNSAPLNLPNAYRLHITAASVRQAVQTLSKLPQVIYVSPDWIAAPMHKP